MSEQLTLAAGENRAVVDLLNGGRLASLLVAGHELLWTETDDGERDPISWGCYPMVPFAGRIRHGMFSFEGIEHAVPKSHEGHAMHGYGFRNPWTQVDDASISYDFGAPWPFAGRATQHFELSADALKIEMRVDALDTQPILIGWHPWFRRENTAGTLAFALPACTMYQRDQDGMPGALVEPPAGPWDDCFTSVIQEPTLEWGDLAADLTSSLDHWVVFDEPDHAICVEPQSGPPNEINTDPRVVGAGESFTASFTLSFSENL